MALDISLFTLSFLRRSNDATKLDLLPYHPAATPPALPSPIYSFSRACSPTYNVQLTDHLTSIPLSSIDAASSSERIRHIELYNPSDKVTLEKKAMTFRQEWRWTFQNQDYLIRKDGRAYIVEADRKPDPEIDVARYNPSTKTRPSFVQLLDYNIQRLEVEDRRGLEVAMITVLCSLLDMEYDEKYKDGPSGNIYFAGISSSSSHQVASAIPTSKQGEQGPGEANEIILDMHTPNEVFVEHALRLMRQDRGGDGLHLIILRAPSIQVTPRAVRIAAEIKAKWYRLEAVAKGRTLDPLPGSTSEIAEELYQYVRDPSQQQKAASSTATTGAKLANNNTNLGPRPRIKLDAPAPVTQSSSSAFALSSKAQKAYAPPPSQLDIYLSKERIDEFEVGLPSNSTNAPPATRPQPSSNHERTGVRMPLIPPKGTPQTKHDSKHDGKHESKHDNNHSDSAGNAKKILGKLGLRKSHASET